VEGEADLCGGSGQYRWGSRGNNTVGGYGLAIGGSEYGQYRGGRVSADSRKTGDVAEGETDLEQAKRECSGEGVQLVRVVRGRAGGVRVCVCVCVCVRACVRVLCVSRAGEGAHPTHGHIGHNLKCLL
jgi:hypothetical protein